MSSMRAVNWITTGLTELQLGSTDIGKSQARPGANILCGLSSILASGRVSSLEGAEFNIPGIRSDGDLGTAAVQVSFEDSIEMRVHKRST